MSVAIFSEVVLALVTLAGGGDSADSANPVVREVIYKNAHHIAKKELDELSGIRPGAPLDLAANKTACFNIQDYLKKKGRYWAQVTLEKGDKAGDDQVIFDVTEGPIVRVRSTNFVGYQTQAELAELRKLIEMGRAFVGLTGPYSQAIIDSDVSKLEEYYDANGYRSAKVNRELSFTPDQCQVDIVYHIHQGPKTAEKENDKSYDQVPGNIPTSPSPGFVRVPGQNVPSDFVTPEIRIPGMSKIAQSGRTTVRFANPTGIKARIFTMDPADAIRANVYQETVLSKEPESGPNAPMFGAGMQSSSGVMGSMVLNDRMPTMEHCWGLSEPRPAGASYRLAQGQTYRVGIAEIEKPVSIGVSATLEVVAQDSKSEQYLSSNTISIAFTDEDFKNVMEAKTVIKIIYLRHAPHAENDGNGTGVQVSTYCGRATDGIDPVREAQRCGTVLLVMRMGIGQIFSESLAPFPQRKEDHSWVFQFSGSFR